MKYVLIGLMGCVGALARYWLSGLIAGRFPAAFPWGTFAVNVSGAFLVGVLATAGIESGLIPPVIRVGLTAGLLGAYTTFSTWSLETMRLLESGSYLLAVWNVFGSILAGLVGAWAGMACGRLLG